MNFIYRRHSWLILSLSVLLISLIILSLSTWQSHKLRSQKFATTEYALTLTRLAQWNVDVTEGALAAQGYTSESTAPLIAAGDVQSRSLENHLNTGAVGEFRQQGFELVARWQQIRAAFSELNQSTLGSAPAMADDEVLVSGLHSTQTSYEALFDAIIMETLSRPLIKLASEIRAQLLSLDILSSIGVNDETHTIINTLSEKAQRLDRIVRPTDGPSILGYHSTLKLKRFFEELAKLRVTNTPVVVSASKPSGTKASIATVTASSLQIAQSLLSALDAALRQSQKNILLASLLASVSLLLSALLALIGRRPHAKRVNSEGVLKLLLHDLARLADGDHSHQSSLHRDTECSSAVAASFDRVAGAIGMQQRLSRDKLNQVSSLAQQQQYVIESMESRLASLSEGCSKRSASIILQLKELQGWAKSVNEQYGSENRDTEMLDAVNDTASSLARLTAQVEVCNGRIDRALNRMQLVHATVSQVESNAGQASLKALNESIKQSDYFDEDGEAEQFVQSVQQISHRLQREANVAMQGVTETQADLNACYQALIDCLDAAEQSTRYTAEATQLIQHKDSEDVSCEIDMTYCQTLLNSLKAEVKQASLVGEASVPEDDLLYLKGHALELQLLAAEFIESTSGAVAAESQQ